MDPCSYELFCLESQYYHFPKYCRFLLNHTVFVIGKLFPHLHIHKYWVRINYRIILQNLMTDTSYVTELFIPPSDRRLKRPTTSKLPSKSALNRHKIPVHTTYARSVRKPFHFNTGLCFSREMAVATIGPFQMLRSLCVIDMNFTTLRHFLLKLCLK
jgi:hypothetical protein